MGLIGLSNLLGHFPRAGIAFELFEAWLTSSETGVKLSIPGVEARERQNKDGDGERWTAEVRGCLS
jgi:hypothetical protein